MGRPPSFEECLQPGADLAAEVARDPVAKQIVDVAQGLEGIVRNASIHAAAVVISDRPLTDIVPLQLADAGTGEDGDEGLPHGHPVLDEADRGDRPAEDGLPGPAQPRRDRGRAGHHRALDRRAAGHGDAPARRREDLRDDGPGRLDRRVPVRVRGHARGAEARSSRPSSRTSWRSWRSTARARWTRSRPTRAASATRRSITYIDDRLRPITESTKGVILYQEQSMQIAKSLAGFSRPEGGRPAQGDRQEEPRGDGQAQARVLRGLPRLGHRART